MADWTGFPWPRSISFACEKGSAAGDRSSGLTRASSSRAFGPMTPSTLHSALTSVSSACSSRPMWRRVSPTHPLPDKAARDSARLHEVQSRRAVSRVGGLRGGSSIHGLNIGTRERA